MYIPASFRVEDREEILAFIAANPFAALVTTHEGAPFATHIPLEVEIREGKTYLTGHLAAANPQWKTFAEGTAMAIFHGPHAYVSSSWYSHPNAPTWNYLVVHAYGRASIVSTERVKEMLISMLDRYEQGQEQPVRWDAIPEELLDKMMQALVGFEIEVERFEAKYKLSQNRNETDYQSIIDHLLQTGRPEERAVAEAMEAIRRTGSNRVYTADKG